MGQVRATLSSAPVDRVIQGHVAVAERAIRAALLECRAVGRRGASPKEDGPPVEYAPTQVSRVRRDLEAALGAIERVRRVAPHFGDPDYEPARPPERPLAPQKPLAPVLEADLTEDNDDVEDDDGS